MSKSNKAHIDRITSLEALKSQISSYWADSCVYIQNIRHDYESQLTHVIDVEHQLELRQAEAHRRLEHAKRAYEECRYRQRNAKDDERISCDVEAGQLAKYESMAMRIDQACYEANQIVNRVRNDCHVLDSTISQFMGSNEKNCSGAVSELKQLIDSAKDYVALKAPKTDILSSAPSALPPQGGGASVGIPASAWGGSDSTKAPHPVGHTLELPSDLGNRYAVNSLKLSTLITDTTGKKIARVSVDNQSAIISMIDKPTRELWATIERIAAHNRITVMSCWVGNEECDKALESGFTIREGTKNDGGAIVEKFIK